MKLPKLHLGIKLFFSFFFVSTIPLVVFSLFWFSSSAQKLGEVQVELSLFALLAFFIILFSILISLFATRKIVNPIKQLEQGARLLANGNLNYRFSATSGDEIEELANEFNNMANALDETFTNLQEERSELEVVISGIADGVIATDLHNNIIIFNDAAEKVTGYTKGDVLGNELKSVIKIFDEENELSPDVYSPVNNETVQGAVFKKNGLKLIGKDNKEVYINLVSGRIKEAKQSNLGCILVLHDMSEERRFEQMKLDFVSMAAHELRTPLTSLRGYLSVFLQEYKGKLDGDQEMFLTRMNISASQLTALVENLLSVSRIERGVFAIHTQEIDWVENVSKIFDELSGRAEEKKIKFTLIKPRKDLPRIKVDRIQINEVLLNLMANALSYTESGGNVEISIEAKDNEVITHIKDTGTGIPKDAIPKLFTKFFRVSGTLETGSKGTGLGLYISKSIIDLHHGRIWVESKVGKGTTFSFALPIG